MIDLGLGAEIDDNESGDANENPGALLGTYGGSGSELYNNFKDAVATDPDSDSIIDNDKLDCASFLYSLHAKSAVFDRETIFVGSFNMNPRSQLLNTETALVVKSKELAARLVADISRDMQPQNSWRLALDDGDDLSWHGETGGKPEVVTHEPQTSFMTRCSALYQNTENPCYCVVCILYRWCICNYSFIHGRPLTPYIGDS